MPFAALLLVAVVGPPLTQAPARSFEGLKLPPGTLAGPVIPGLREGAVPQGLAWTPATDDAPACFLISHDRADAAASCVSVVEAKSGTLRAVVALAEPDGTPHAGHVGGLAAIGDDLFLASDGRVLRYPLAPFLSDTPPPTLAAAAEREDETQADCCTARIGAEGSELWVGEFARYALFSKDYPTDSTHHVTDRAGVSKYAWICRSDPGDPTGRVTGILSVRQRVQGLCFLPPTSADRNGDRINGNASGEPGEIVLSLSYGRTNDSSLVVYRDPTGDPPHRTATLDGRDVPLWFLDERNFVRETTFPPMSEGIAFVPAAPGAPPRLAVLSESGAKKYQSGGRGPLDVIALLPIAP
ncbi:hypothetical protein [Alienimonas chondri]|uniref:BPP domain-containing protein n=1 Tax=Alienimonas chondri TaxID=2681879 RepID=A0ABX1VGW7_9PLAN|nr:hypothetical protein [Alienimonas chondri]NNJ27082.1 hypothetical protein [Alienimonas chondri]